MEGPMQLSPVCHMPYHPLEIAKLGVEHSGVFRRGGIGAAERSESPEARLMWIVCFDGQYADFTSFSLGRERMEQI